MAVLLKVMEAAAKSSTVLEDAFLTVGAVTAAVEADFVRYMERFTPILYQALSNHEEHQVSAGFHFVACSPSQLVGPSQRCAALLWGSLAISVALSTKRYNHSATRS